MPVLSNRRQFLGQTAALALGAMGNPTCAADPAVKGLVTGQPEGAEVGNQVLANGGNAVDAIVAAALTAGVTAISMTGIAGYGGHLVVARPEGKVTTIDFNSTASAAARPDMFAADDMGRVKGNMHAHGWLAPGVPGVLAGLQLALDRHGSKSFMELVKPAIRFAREGFPLSKMLAGSIKLYQEQFRRDAGSAKLFIAGGEPLKEGAIYRNPDLADMLQTLAEKGRVDSFYQGAIADKIAAGFKKNKGIVTAADLAAYKPLEVTPLSLEWRGFTIHTPPPTAGSMNALQALAALKALNWSDMDPKDTATAQARVEALRIAWNDRLRYLGDPKQVEVPIERLLSERHAKESADHIRTALEERKPVAAETDGLKADGTIHLTAVDASGMMAALTFTHGDGFGAQVTVDGLGLILGHSMSRFDPRPGRANSIAPGKRPQNNMCPMVVTRDGKPLLAFGAVGGRKIVNTVFDFLVYRIGEGRSLAAAATAPRVHTEGDLALTLEAAWPAAVTEHFKKVGYEVSHGPGARLDAIERDSSTGALTSAAR